MNEAIAFVLYLIGGTIFYIVFGYWLGGRWKRQRDERKRLRVVCENEAISNT